MAWTKYTIPRIRFIRYGSDLLDWTAARGLKIIYKATAGVTGTCGFDQFQVTAGADGKALLGDFRLLYRYAYQDGAHLEASRPSPASDIVYFNTSAAKISIPQSAALAMDTQVKEVWPYFWSERMGAYYRAIDPISLNRPKFTLNEFYDVRTGGIGPDERRRVLLWGFVVGRRYTPGDDPITTFPVTTSSTATVTADQTPALTFSSQTGSVTNPGAGEYRVTAPDGGTILWSNAGVATGTINSVVLDCLISGDGATSSGLAYPAVKIGATTYYGSFLSFGPDASQPFSKTWTNSPATGLPWTLSELASALFGIYIEMAVGTSYGTVVIPTMTANVTTTTVSGGSSVGTFNVLTFSIQTSETELLLRNEPLRVGQEDPPDNIIGLVFAQHMQRWVALTVTELHFAAITFASSFEPLQRLRIAGDESERALWITTAGGAILVGTTVDIYEIAGDGADLPDGTLNIQVRPLHLGSPPIDRYIAQEGNTIIYHASDGYRVLSGNSSALIRGDANLLFMGYTRHGVPPLDNTYGRHPAAISDSILSMLHVDPTSRNFTPVEFSTPDNQVTAQDRARVLTFGWPLPGGSSTALLRYDLPAQKWTRAVYPFRITALHTTAEDRLLAGTAEGNVYYLDSGYTDSGTSPEIVVWTKSDDDGLPLNRKVPFDISIGMDTQGDTVTVSIYLDETLAVSFSASCTGHQIYKRTISTLAVYRRIQVRISGTPGSSTAYFKLYDVNVSYRSLPQHRYFVDTGNVQSGREDLHWFREINILLRSPADVTVACYFDDTLNVTKTVTVTANVAKVYTIALGREVKGRQPRIVIATSSSAAATELGFEVFWVKWFFRPSGNENQKAFLVWRPDNTPES